jgi:two-component system sensor histidine kinase ChiS
VQTTGTTKVEMAEESRIWNIYMEKDGYLRTQTLDKYLNEDTLPLRPRWQNVYATAEFVLTQCRQNLAIRQELAQALLRLKTLS